MAIRILKTTILFSLAGQDEREADVEVTYTVTPGYAETRLEPGAEMTVEIEKIVIVGGPEPIDITWIVNAGFYADADFEEMIGEELAGEEQDAAEYRADARRDDAMMERF